MQSPYCLSYEGIMHYFLSVSKPANLTILRPLKKYIIPYIKPKDWNTVGGFRV